MPHTVVEVNWKNLDYWHRFYTGFTWPEIKEIAAGCRRTRFSISLGGIYELSDKLAEKLYMKIEESQYQDLMKLIKDKDSSLDVKTVAHTLAAHYRN